MTNLILYIVPTLVVLAILANAYLVQPWLVSREIKRATQRHGILTTEALRRISDPR